MLTMRSYKPSRGVNKRDTFVVQLGESLEVLVLAVFREGVDRLVAVVEVSQQSIRSQVVFLDICLSREPRLSSQGSAKLLMVACSSQEWATSHLHPVLPGIVCIMFGDQGNVVQQDECHQIRRKPGLLLLLLGHLLQLL
jgi:hypothetical protein